jgi:UDP:flavonoid glycosyltransferase YjiC (YdhE family)
MIPLTSEQYLLAKRVETAGMGLTAAANNIDEIRVLVRRLLETASFRAAAQRFQARYAHQSLASNAGGIAETIDKLVQTR